MFEQCRKPTKKRSWITACYLDFMHFISETVSDFSVLDISSMRRSVSSSDEALRRELQIPEIDPQRSIFNQLSGVSFDDETLCRKLDIT